jgi:hypothetical protein
LTEDNPTIKPYQESKWAELHDVKDVPIEASLLILEGVHARLVSLLSNMDALEFASKYTHPEYGKSMNLAYTVGMYAWHGKHHLAHINNGLSSKIINWV